MTARIIDGKAIAAELRVKIAGEVKRLAAQHGITPGLAVVLVGEDPASEVYVRNKGEACRAAGMHSHTIRLPESSSEAELLATVDRLNADHRIHGFLIQLPLPKHINSERVLLSIDPAKDVDGFHPENVGRLAAGDRDVLPPCTPAGVIELLVRAKIPIEGKHAVVIGRSDIVGKPMAALLLHKNATVTICHSRTRDLPAMARTADILVAAIGRPAFVTKEFVKPGAVVIDVGINRLPPDQGGKLCGDVDFASAREVAGLLTPVPGGVGPMTITMLLANTLESAERHAARFDVWGDE